MAGCCPPGSHGAVQPPADYVPQGTIKTIGGSQVYIVGEPGPKGLIALPDLFGVDSGRTKAICDHFAKHGYFVVLPDVFLGKPFEENEKALSSWRLLFYLAPIIRFIYKNRWRNVQKLYMDHVIPFMQSEGVTSIGTISFCFGGYIASFLAMDQNIKASVCFHPSVLQICQISRESYKDVFKKVTGPFLMCCSNQEGPAILPGGEIEKILSAREMKESEFLEFKTMKHGWVNRGDVKNEEIRKEIENALGLATSFLEKHL